MGLTEQPTSHSIPASEIQLMLGLGLDAGHFCPPTPKQYWTVMWRHRSECHSSETKGLG
jgi:hypothetical protein